MACGAFYPTLVVPDWLRGVTVIKPGSSGVHALRPQIFRGQGLELI